LRARLETAAPGDAAELAALQNSVSAALSVEFGVGHWSIVTTPEAVLRKMRTDRVLRLRLRRRIVATLRLSGKKPWAIDRACFVAGQRPLYLLDMAVAPGLQRRGLGRRCLAEAADIARATGADAIRLDAYDAPAGAGGFYAACGFAEVRRVVYRRVPLIYYELLL
jgi:GNAT superfamily N-acetyltransferase